MTNTIAYFLFAASVILLVIDLINQGFNFEEGRIYRNISSLLIIFVACSAIYKNKKNSLKKIK